MRLTPPCGLLAQTGFVRSASVHAGWLFREVSEKEPHDLWPVSEGYAVRPQRCILLAWMAIASAFFAYAQRSASESAPRMRTGRDVT